jgi:hypothetical protein
LPSDKGEVVFRKCSSKHFVTGIIGRHISERLTSASADDQHRPVWDFKLQASGRLVNNLKEGRVSYKKLQKHKGEDQTKVFFSLY